MENKPIALSRRTLLETAVFASMIGGVPFVPAQASEWTAGEKANIQVVSDFCAAWSSRDMTRPLAFLAPDCVYRMSETTAPVNGHEGVIQRLKDYVDATQRLEFGVLKTFAAGPLVMNQRIDRFVSSTRPLTWEGVGVFFLQNGKIKEWFDYTIRVTR